MISLSKNKTLIQALDHVFPVRVIAFSKSGNKFAIVTADRIVHLYDEKNEKRSKFSTKPRNKGDLNSYCVKDACFSPDDTKLAVAQTDNIIFVYKLGNGWDEKITISNKFKLESPATCLTWPNELFFGSIEGKLFSGKLKSNQENKLYSSASALLRLCYKQGPRLANEEITKILAGHLDGKVFIVEYHQSAGRGATLIKYSRLIEKKKPIYCLSWGSDVCVATTDKVVTFHSPKGKLLQMFEGEQDDIKGFYCSAMSASGTHVFLGGFNGFKMFSQLEESGEWNLNQQTKVPFYHSLFSACWHPSGDRLVLGTSCGCVDLYSCCLMRKRYRDTFEFVYLSWQKVNIVHLESKQSLLLNGRSSSKINSINVYHNDEYILAKTEESIIVGVWKTKVTSEFPWAVNGTEKFLFENPLALTMVSAGELIVFEYGREEVSAILKTCLGRSSLISLKINERPFGVSTNVGDDPSGWDNKKIAYLLDKHTIEVFDIVEESSFCVLKHHIGIDWLELNAKADSLLFRDRNGGLHCCNLVTGVKLQLLSSTAFTQWVQLSDVIVAEGGNRSYIWYSIDWENLSTTRSEVPIKGKVLGIEEISGSSQIKIKEPNEKTSYYPLDDTLVSFKAFLDDGFVAKALLIVSEYSADAARADKSAEMWTALAKAALMQSEFGIVERSFAAIGNISAARIFRKINKVFLKLKMDLGEVDAREHWLVQTMLLKYKCEFKLAEEIYLKNNQLREAILMYVTLEDWEKAVILAETHSYGELKQFRQDYEAYLTSTTQLRKLGILREGQEKIEEALELYLKAGAFMKASNLVLRHGETFSRDSICIVAEELRRKRLFESAGVLFEEIDDFEEALDCYNRAYAFEKAVELARRVSPDAVVDIESEWGEYLIKLGQHEPAIKHFVEAGKSKRAARACLSAGLWKRAEEISLAMKKFDFDTARIFLMELGEHYKVSGQYVDAEKVLVHANAYKECTEMYASIGEWQKAHAIGQKYMAETELRDLVFKHAESLTKQKKFSDAESLYLGMNEPDQAIRMYQKAEKFEDMIRLVSVYRKEKLQTTLLHLGQRCEAQGNFNLAERYYLRGKSAVRAVEMHASRKRFDLALKFAKQHLSDEICAKVILSWRKELGEDETITILRNTATASLVIDFLLKQKKFDLALRYAEKCCTEKLSDVDKARGEHLKEEDRFEEAHQCFVRANCGSEAVKMYLEKRDFLTALKIAEEASPEDTSLVLMEKGQHEASLGNYDAAEDLFISVNRPDLSLAMYERARQWSEAMRVATSYFPDKLPLLKKKAKMDESEGYASSSRLILREEKVEMNEESIADPRDVYDSAQTSEEARDFKKAIKKYLSAIPPDSTGNMESSHKELLGLLESGWERALELSKIHVKSLQAWATETAAQNFFKTRNYNTAAKLFESLDMVGRAVESYCKALDFTNAFRLAENDCHLQEVVEDARRNCLEEKGDYAELEKVGAFSSAIQIHIENKQWDEAFKLVASDAPQLAEDVLMKYLNDEIPKASNDIKTIYLICERLLRHAKWQKGRELNKTYIEALNLLFNLVISEGVRYPPAAELEPCIKALRGSFHAMFQAVGSSSLEESSFLAEKFLVCQLWQCYCVSKKNSLKDLSCYLSIFFLYFTHLIPADYVYFVAGTECRCNNLNGKAFVLLNKFIDICEAIADQDESVLEENTDTVDTDLPQDLFPNGLPKTAVIEEDIQEEIREYVLGSAMQTELNFGKNPFDQQYLDEVKAEISQQLEHFLRRYDSESFEIHKGKEITKVLKSFGL
eukprot:snap_masked-scaffold_6-processed-gene-8.30-mRNA-1 protein AED:0.46 eAED:0.46 QI:0/-1/0/1/-1/1/1/0/1777